MFSTKKQKLPLLQIHLEMHWGGDPLFEIFYGYPFRKILGNFFVKNLFVGNFLGEISIEEFFI